MAARHVVRKLPRAAKSPGRSDMLARVRTVAFHGVEVIDVETQVSIASGLPAFTVVGLQDEAVAESRERVSHGAGGARSLAATARNRPDQHRPRQQPRHLPGPGATRGGDDPVPLRLAIRAGPGLQPCAALRPGLPGAYLRPAARPHRPAYRCAGGVPRRPRAAAIEGEQRGAGAPGRRRPRTAALALRG